MGWTDKIREEKTEDQDIIEMYDSLDDKGRHTVQTVLKMEYDRCKKAKRFLMPVAAHNDDTSEEQQKLMHEDLDEL